MAPFKWVLNTGGILMYDNISEGQYLIKLLGTAINNSQLDCPQEDFSWNKLFMLASFHSVANTAFYGLQKLSNNSVVPDDIFENFSSFLNALFRIIVVNDGFAFLQGCLYVNQTLVAASPEIEFLIPQFFLEFAVHQYVDVLQQLGLARVAQ